MDQRTKGSISFNAKWTQYGAYLQKMIDGVDARWKAGINATLDNAPTGGSITVAFVMNDQGVVTSTKATAPNVDDVWVQVCIKAINPGPGFSHGAWTPEMVANLGRSQELTFYFAFR